jgi:hypothetical protein
MRVQLPFSHDAFLDVFGAYNAALWPAAVVLWVLTAGVAWRWLRCGRVGRQVVFAMLAVHWAWSGIVYHWFYFRDINPAAALFAVVFLLQAALLGWLAVRSGTDVSADGTRRTITAAVLVLYGLLYPVAGVAFGLRYPRLPFFAVPCSTTLVTAGFLVASAGVPRLASAVPIVWAVIGTSAAFVLGIRADLALAVAAAVLILDSLVPKALGPRAAAQHAPAADGPERPLL